MNLLCSFIQKDITEFRRSRKMLLIALFAMFYPIILNILTDQPLLPPLLLMLPFSICSACGFGGELLHFFTINEIKYRIFDIFLISKTEKVHLLLCKVAFPFLCSFLLAFVGMVMNHIFAGLFSHYEFVSAVINFETILILAACSLFGTLVQFGAIMLIDNPKDYTLTATLALSMVSLILMYIAGFMFGMPVFFATIITVILCLVFLDCHLINMYRRTRKSRNRLAFQSIFPDKTISEQSALLRKEIIVSGVNVFTVIPLILSSAFPIVLYSFMATTNDMELLRVLFRIALYFVCTFGVLNILFPVAKAEQINRYTDIFKVAGTNKRKLYVSKSILPFLTMFVGLFLSFLLTWIYCNQMHLVFLFDYVAFVTSIFSTACSVFISLWLVRYIHSYKDVRPIGFFLSVITFTLHTILSFIPYWFF